MADIDRRRVDALLLQVDALARELGERKDQEINAALTELNRALEAVDAVIEKQGCYLTLPHDYKRPYRGTPKGK